MAVLKNANASGKEACTPPLWVAPAYAFHRTELSAAHSDGHAENHDWYQNLTQPDTGFPCCNGSTSSVEGDCRPTRAFLDEDGLWYALLDGQWVPIPPRVVLKRLAPDGHSHICASQSGVIYCFLAGSPKT
jgi:hypothetical protein